MKKVPRHQESVQFKIPENLPYVPGKISPPSQEFLECLLTLKCINIFWVCLFQYFDLKPVFLMSPSPPIKFKANKYVKAYNNG